MEKPNKIPRKKTIVEKDVKQSKKIEVDQDTEPIQDDKNLPQKLRVNEDEQRRRVNSDEHNQDITSKE